MAPSSPALRRSSSSSSSSNSTIRTTLTIADTASWYCSIILVGLILFTTFRDSYTYEYDHDHEYEYDYDYRNSLYDHDQGGGNTFNSMMYKGNNFIDHRGPCDEIYVVTEGETLHTISDKCGDPFIVERNPHIHDPDDVFPGLVIRIVPSARS